MLAPMAIEPEKWTSRAWSFELPLGRFPNVLERLRGTPVRARELVAGVPEDLLSRRIASKWSAKEHIAHLDDLHELDETRLAEFLSGAETLTAADMTNARTENAGHNETPMDDILERFTRRREGLITKLEGLSEDEVGLSCFHPRLKKKLRLIDWAYFVAEHDDHHLVRARATFGRRNA